MKRTVTLLLLCCIITLGGHAQGWRKAIDKEFFDDPIQMEKTSYGHLILGNYLTNTNDTVIKYFLLAVDSAGQELWYTQHSIPKLGQVHKFVILSTGEIVILGSYLPVLSNFVSPETFLAKHSATGARIWYKEYADTTETQFYNSLLALPGDTLLLANETWGSDTQGNYSGIGFYKINNNGDSIAKLHHPIQYGSPGYYFKAMEHGHGNSIMATATSSLLSGIAFTKILQFDYNLNLLWSDTIMSTGPQNQFVYTGITPTTAGGYLLSGNMWNVGYNGEVGAPVIRKINAAGTKEWEYNWLINGEITSVVETASGHLAVLSTIESSTSGGINKVAKVNLKVFSGSGQVMGDVTYAASTLEGYLWSTSIHESGNGYLLCAKEYNHQFNQVWDIILIKTDSSGNAYNSAIIGTVFKDGNANCQKDSQEISLRQWIISAVGNSSYFGVTDSAGNYSIACEPGTYSIKTFPPNNYWIDTACTSTITLTGPTDTAIADLGMGELAACPLMAVSVNASYLQQCQAGAPYKVQYCNNGTVEAIGAYIEVSLHADMVLDSASIASVALGNNYFRFDLDTVGVNKCGNIKLYVRIDCAAEVTGQDFCVEVEAYPSTDCLPLNSAWDGARLELESTCGVDSVMFQLTNTGSDMSVDRFYAIVQDDIMYVQGNVRLQSGEVFVHKVPANGSTWTFISEQTPYFPGNLSLMKSLEGCGVNSNGGYSTGFLVQYPQIGPDRNIAFLCLKGQTPIYAQQKTVQPRGFGDEGYVNDGQQFAYTISYSNWGTDTIQNIVFRDVLSSNLDISTLTNVFSSHPMLWTLNGPTLIVTFDSIDLPPSNVDATNSIVYFSFNIDAMDSLDWGTRIENTAQITLNDTVHLTTNTTLNTIGNIYGTLMSVTEINSPENRLRFYPNPTQGILNLEIEGALDGETFFLVYDLTGKRIHEQQLPIGNSHQLQLNLQPGTYLFEVQNNGQRLGTGKLLSH